MFKLHWSYFMQVAAIFNVLHNTPPIPETLSSEGTDFLRCCFQRLPEERPSAAMLLEHPFVKKSEQLDGPSCNWAFNGKNLMGNINVMPLIVASENKLIIPALLQKGKNCYWLFLMGSADMQLWKLYYRLHRCYSRWLAAIGCCDRLIVGSLPLFFINSSHSYKSFFLLEVYSAWEFRSNFCMRASDITVT